MAAPTNWFVGPTATDPTTAASLGSPTTGSISVGTVTPTPYGCDMVVHLGTTQASDSVRLSLCAQVNGNWSPVFVVPQNVSLPSPGWSTITLQVNYAAVEQYLQTANITVGVAGLGPGALLAEFPSTNHNTGMPGTSANSGTDRDTNNFNWPQKL